MTFFAPGPRMKFSENKEVCSTGCSEPVISPMMFQVIESGLLLWVAFILAFTAPFSDCLMRKAPVSFEMQMDWISPIQLDVSGA